MMRCRVCKCSEREPCNPPCAWEAPGLCTTCAAAIAALVRWEEDALNARFAALVRAAKAYIDSPFIQASRTARGVGKRASA